MGHGHSTHHADPHFTPVAHEQPDEWHIHSKAEGAPQSEHGNIAKPHVIGAWLVIIIVFVVAFIGATYFYFRVYTTRLVNTKAETTVLSRGTLVDDGHQSMKNREEALKQGYSWIVVDGQPTRVRVPLSKAMEQVTQAYAAGKAPAPADPPAPAPAPAPAK